MTLAASQEKKGKDHEAPKQTQRGYKQNKT